MYSEKINELKKITDGHLASIASDLPESPDGKSAKREIRYELRGKNGELLTEANSDLTFFGEIVFALDGQSEGSEMVFSFSLAVKDGEYDENALFSSLSELHDDVKRFYSELDGNAHGEYFEKLSFEREAELMPKEDEKSPFDYKKFMIYASVAAVAIGALAFLINALF